MINVCDAINCPFNDRRNGCLRYTSTAQACHLNWTGTGRQRDGMAPPMTSQYWLYATESADIEELRRINQMWLDSPATKPHLRILNKLAPILAQRAKSEGITP